MILSLIKLGSNKKVAAEFESTELQHLLVDKFKNEIVWP